MKALETSGNMTTMSIWNHFDFLCEFYLCVCFMTYDFFYRELESTEIIWNLQWHIFLALKKISTGRRIPPRKRSIICSKLHQCCGPNLFQYGRPRHQRHKSLKGILSSSRQPYMPNSRKLKFDLLMRNTYKHTHQLIHALHS